MKVSAHCGSAGKGPLICTRPWGLAKCTVSSEFLRHSFCASSQGNFRIVLLPLHFQSVLVYVRSPCGPTGARVLCRNKQLLVPGAGPMPSVLPALQQPCWSLLKSPGSHFCGRFHLVSQSLRWGGTWHSPPISHVQDNLQTALKGSPSPATNRLLLLPPLSDASSPFPSWPACKWGDVKS